MTAHPVTLHVCTSCRAAGGDPATRPGERLHAELSARLDGRDDICLSAVECLSVCRRPASVAFAAPGKWTYVTADAASADEVLLAASLYAESEDGRVPWRERPDLLKSGLVARIPPLPETSR